jgi:hypothetical protein
MAATSPTRPDSPHSTSPEGSVGAGRGSVVREALAFCLQRRNLSRTIPIALVVGVVLTLINQGSVIADGHATVATWARCALNFIVPFLVSNAGLLSARR